MGTDFRSLLHRYDDCAWTFVEQKSLKRMFQKLDALLHSQLRLAVMSILMGVEQADFTYLKEQTNSTAGNLSVQLDKLSKAGYITTSKSFVGRKTCTSCAVTEKGRKAFAEYVEALKTYLTKQ
jgi:DNA-binding MarR family transcriptional regulator